MNSAIVESIRYGGRRYSEGMLQTCLSGSEQETITLPDSLTVKSASIESGELEAAHCASKAPDVVACFAGAPGGPIRFAFPLTASLLVIRAIRQFAVGKLADVNTFVGRGVNSDPRHGMPTALLGADYAPDAKSGSYRFARIYRGDQSRPAMAGPLGVPGLNVKDGDYLLTIVGQELRAPDTPDSLLSGVEGETTQHGIDDGIPEIPLILASHAAGQQRVLR